MQENFQHKKELHWLKPGEITIREEYRLYAPRERTDLIHSIPESGVHEPLTALLENPNINLLNGFDRMDVINSQNLQEIKIPVWVILDPLSEDQRKKLILDLGRQKQKTKTDYAKEFELYDSIIPNEQGKNMGGHNRYKLIAGLMGISTSQLSQILRIQKAMPSLLQEVDNGHRTLSDAEQKAKQINREKKQGEAGDKSDGINSPGKKVDMEPIIDVCPTCKRKLSETDWKDLPGMFPFKRDETNNQTDWMEPITNEEIEEIEKSLTKQYGENHEE